LNQIKWQQVTGHGAPALTCTSNTLGSATTVVQGAPYTNIDNGDFYVCSSPSGTPTWVKVTGGGGGSGTVSGQASGVIGIATNSTTTGAQSHINENTGGQTTVTQALAVNDGSGKAGAVSLAQGTTPTAAATNNIQLDAPSSVTAYDVVLPGAQPSGSNTFLSCTSANPSVCSWAAGGGGGSGYTNVNGTASQTTVALLNTLCASGTIYATTPLSIATGGTLSCAVQFSKAGLWTIASGQTVTFSQPITETDGPNQHFAGSGTVALAAQDARPEWWGAVADGNYASVTGTDNATAFQAAITALTSGNMVLQCGTYKVTAVTNIHAKNNVGIKGCQTSSKARTTGTVVFTTSTSATIFDFAGTGVAQNTYMYHNYISDLDLKRSTQPTSTATNLSLVDMCGAFVSRVFSEDAVRAFYLKGFGNCGAGRIEDSNAQWGFGNFTENNSVTYTGFYIDTADPPGSTILSRIGAGSGLGSGTTATLYGLQTAGSGATDIMVNGFQTELMSYGWYMPATNGAQDVHCCSSIPYRTILPGSTVMAAKTRHSAI
jgi:hypothetical protein